MRRTIPRPLRGLPTGLLFPGLLCLGVGPGCAGEDVLAEDPIPVATPHLPPVGEGLEMEARSRIVELQMLRDGGGLAAFLAHADPSVRARAALALASVQDPGAIGGLTGLLQDPEWEVRRDAAFALGQVALSDEGLGLLAALRAEEEVRVRLRLLEALGKQGGEEVADELVSLQAGPEEAEAHRMALSGLLLRSDAGSLPDVVEALARSLYSGDERTREAAAYYFGRSSDPDGWRAQAELLREAADMMSPESPALMHLATAWGRLRDPRDEPRLRELLGGSPDWRIRTNAARALAAPEFLEMAGVRSVLWEAVREDPSQHVAVAAAEALTGGFQIPEETLEEAEHWVRELPDRWRTHVPFLRPLVNAGRGGEVLSWLQWQASGDESGAVLRGIEVTAAMVGEEAGALLFLLADHEDPEIRARAIAGLGERWPRDMTGEDGLLPYAERFAEALGASEPLAAASAARALGHPAFRSYGSVPLLREAWEARGAPHLESGEEVGIRELPVLTALLAALGETGDPGVVEVLDQALSSPDYRVRRAAARAREELTGEEIRGLGIPDPERWPDDDLLADLGPRPRLVLETDRGRLEVALIPDQAPLTVSTIAGLAASGAYDGTRFHRVVPNFVVQGGDVSLGDGMGGPGFAIRSEFTQLPFQRGVIGMASLGKDTEGSQFFLTHSAQPHLDGAYTAFGWVVSGEDVLDRLLEGDCVLQARVVPDPSP